MRGQISPQYLLIIGIGMVLVLLSGAAIGRIVEAVEYMAGKTMQYRTDLAVVLGD